MPKPNFFIAGAPKCGTTALYEYLKPHPEIFLADIKEPYYFGTDIRGPKFEVYRGSEALYLTLFDGATTHKCIGEASPSYLASERAPEEIHAFDPHAKIIIMLRNPIEQLHSMYHHRRYMGDEIAPTFEAAITPELAGQPAQKNVLPYLLLTRFAPGVKRYLDHFGREQVHIIIFDDFRRDLPKVYNDTLRFLGVDTHFQPDFAVVNASKEVRSPLMQKLLQILHLTPKDVRDSRIFQTLSKRLSPRIYSAMIDMGTRLYTRPQKYGQIDSTFRQRLQAYFLPDIEALSALLERDLTHWCTLETIDLKPVAND